MASYDGRGYNNFGIIEPYGGREKAVDPAQLSPTGNEYTTAIEDYEPQEEGVDKSTPPFSRNKVSPHECYSYRDNTPPSRNHHHGKYYNPDSCSSDDESDGDNEDHEGHHKTSAFGEAPRDHYASLRKIGMEGFDLIDELDCSRVRGGVPRARYDGNPCAAPRTIYDDNPCAAPRTRYDNPGSLVQDKVKIEIPSVTTLEVLGTPCTKYGYFKPSDVVLIRCDVQEKDKKKTPSKTMPQLNKSNPNRLKFRFPLKWGWK